MKKTFQDIIQALLAVALLLSCCSCKWLFPEEEKVDEEFVAEVLDDPKARPGVVLSIGVTANGSQVLPPSEYRVDPDGNIILPYINTVKCDGLTLQDIKAKVEQLYGEKFYNGPQASVDFKYTPGASASPWGTINVQGQVGSPGPIDIPRTRDLTLTRALKLAGGVNAMGDRDDIQVSFLKRDGSILRKSYSLTKIGKGRVDMDVKLPPGTTIFVPYANY